MRKFVILVALLALVALPVMGQVRTGNIYGKVVDAASGQPLPGVAITLTGNKIAPITAISSAEGNFRFLSLPPGTYNIKAELQGFKTVVRKGIRLVAGADVNIVLKMEEGTIKQEITVTAAAPIVDTRKAQVGVNITKESLEELPTSRNPWVFLELAPGVLVDREDVGGNEGGQQSSYTGHGVGQGQSTWNVDGANITDPAAIGAAPAYLNMMGYEEFQVTIGAADIEYMTGGIHLNFISRRGGNKMSGLFYLFGEDERWQRDNVPDDLKAKGYTGNKVRTIYHYGANFGGPIIKDRLWFYVSWGVQDIGTYTLAGTSDDTWLESGYGKINFQLGSKHRAEFFVEYDNKKKWGRTAYGATQQAPETTWNQTGPGYIWKAESEHFFGNLMLNFKAIYTNGGFHLAPKGGLEPYCIFEFYPKFYVRGSFLDYQTDRNQWNIVLRGDYFKEAFLGGDHEFKFGIEYLDAIITTTTTWPHGGTILYKFGPDLWVAEANSVGYIEAKYDRYSAYIQDIMNYGRLTINVGLRYDIETNKLNPGTVQGAEIMRDYIPDLDFAGSDVKPDWKMFSPRLNLVYDITGDSKTLFKLALARYGSQGGINRAYFVNPINVRYIAYLWVDRNGDGVVTEDELLGYPNLSWAIWYGGFDPANPTSTQTPNRFDPNYHSPYTYEAIASIEREIMPNLAVSIQGVYRRVVNQTWDMYIKSYDPLVLESKDDWVVAGYIPEIDKYYYTLSYYKPAGRYRTNHDKYYTDYKAIQLILNKRLSNRWMLNASFTYDDWRQHWEDEYFDPTNKDFFDGGVVAPESGGSGIRGIYVNSRWMFKAAGLYQLPYDFNISFTLVAREGYVIPRYWYISDRGSGLGSVNVYYGKFGDTRLPTFWMLNLRLEKKWEIANLGRLYFSIDGFNITNNNMALKKEPRMNASNYMEVQRILNPTVFEFGIRFEF